MQRWIVGSFIFSTVVMPPSMTRGQDVDPGSVESGAEERVVSIATPPPPSIAAVDAAVVEGRFDEALAMTDALVDDAGDVSSLAEALVRRGAVLLTLDREENARLAFARVHVVDPTFDAFPDWVGGRARALFREGAQSEAASLRCEVVFEEGYSRVQTQVRGDTLDEEVRVGLFYRLGDASWQEGHDAVRVMSEAEEVACYAQARIGAVVFLRDGSEDEPRVFVAPAKRSLRWLGWVALGVAVVGAGVGVAVWSAGQNEAGVDLDPLRIDW